MYWVTKRNPETTTMSDSFNRFIDDLIDDSDFDAEPTKKPGEYARKQFTCESCNGSGQWVGGRNRYGNHKCHICNGLGYLVTSKADRMKAKAQRQQRKVDQIVAAKQAMDDTGLPTKLAPMCDWNDFARSLMTQYEQGKTWSERQVAAARNMVAKVEAKRIEKTAAKEAAATMVDLAPIADMFATALASGYKKPMYRANGLRIKPGKGGALYVMTENRTEFGAYGEQPAYEGKITGGKFYGVRASAEDTPAKLLAIATDPRGEAVRYGQRTGTCSCCGRELTKHSSIEAGIGPICAEKWGL